MFNEELCARLPILHLMPPNQAEIGHESLSTPVSPRLVHVTRITGALSISALTLDPNSTTDGDRVHRACEIVRQATVMRKDPNYAGGDPNNAAATLTIVYTPYHPVYGAVPKPNEPNCAWCPGPPPAPWCEPMEIDDPRGGCYDTDEIKLYTDRVQFVKDKVSSFNVAGDPNEPGKPVTIGQQFLDDERWNVTANPDWDDAVTAKHNLFYDEGKSLLPDKPIYQYDRGAAYYVDLQPSGAYNPWFGEWYALDEKGDDYEVSLYNVWDLDRARAMMARTAQQASDKEGQDPNAAGTDQLVPWLCLGCGQPEIGYGEAYEPDMDYGLGAARDIAAMLRVLCQESNPFGVTHPVEINQIALYPEPFCPDTPRFAQYFVEYVRGFTD